MSISNIGEEWKNTIAENFEKELNTHDLETYDFLKRMIMEKLPNSKERTITCVVENRATTLNDFHKISTVKKQVLQYFEFRHNITIKIEKTRTIAFQPINEFIITFKLEI